MAGEALPLVSVEDRIAQRVEAVLGRYLPGLQPVTEVPWQIEHQVRYTDGVWRDASTQQALEVMRRGGSVRSRRVEEWQDGLP